MNKPFVYIIVVICYLIAGMSLLHIAAPYLFYGVINFYKDIVLEITNGLIHMSGLELFAISCVFFGVWYIAKPDIKGLWAMFFAQVAWTIHGIKSGQYALAFQSIVLFIINIKGILNWKRQNIRSITNAGDDNSKNSGGV